MASVTVGESLVDAKTRDKFTENSNHLDSKQQQPTHRHPITLKNAQAGLIPPIAQQAALLLIPACFIALGILLALLRDKPESPTGQGVVQASQVAATIWPIAFAAVLGATLHTVALYHAQRGTQLEVLDMLLTSQTVGGTLKYLVFTYRFSLGLAILVLVWSFSPVGGQAVLRIVELQPNINVTTQDIVYFPVANISNVTQYSPLLGASSKSSTLPTVKALVLSSLYDGSTSIIHSNNSSPQFGESVSMLGGAHIAAEAVQQDRWGNIRIPFIHLLEGYDAGQPQKWIDIPTDRVAPYQSLIGIPIRGLSPNVVGNTTAYINSTYHFLQCSGTWENQTTWALSEGRTLPNVSDSGLWATQLQYYAYMYSVEVGTRFEFRSSTTLAFFSLNNVTTCHVRSSVVEVEVRCTKFDSESRTACRSNRIRHPPSFEEYYNTTLFFTDRGSSVGTYGIQLVTDMPLINTATHPAEFNAFQMYLVDPTAGFSNNAAYGDEFCDVPKEAFEARLGLLINTYWMASLNPTTVLQRDGINGPQDVNWTSNIFSDGAKYLHANSTGTTFSYTEPTYQISMPWLIVYFLAAAVLTAAAACNLCLRLTVCIPDFLGSVFALARDTPFISLSGETSSAMSSMEQGKLLGGKWVRVQDVQPLQPCGRIAVSDDTTLASQPLNQERLYE